MVNTLNVSYVSQITGGALEHNNDCGAASALMLLHTYDLAKDVTVDQLYNSIVPSGDTALSVGQLQIKMASYGLKNEWKVDNTISSAFEYLRNSKPCIALIHYGVLVDAKLTQRTAFRGAHFVVTTGADLDVIYINDPYRTDSVTNVAVPHDVFEKAWKDCVLDGNPTNGLIAPLLPIQDLSAPAPVDDEYYLLVNGLNVRQLPSGNSLLVRTIWKTTEPIVHALASTLTNGYVRLTDGTGWVWFEYLKKK